MLTGAFPAELVDDVIERTGAREQRSRSLPARLMMYYVLALGLFAEHSYEEVMRLLARGLDWLSGNSRAWRMPSGPAIAKARSRLGEAPFALLFGRVVGPVATEETPGSCWRNLRLMAIDTLLINVPDTAENAAFFGRPDGRGDAPGPPQMWLVALGECGTGALVGAAFGRPDDGLLARGLLSALDSQTLLLVSGALPWRELWPDAVATGTQVLYRTSRPNLLPVTRVLPDGTWLSQLTPPDEANRDPLPVRVIECEMPGSRRRPAGTSVTLITTLLDPAQAPAEELATLYARRWRADSIFTSVETRRRGADVVLRSKKPDLIRQEVWAMLCVYQGILTSMRQAGSDRADPRRSPARRAIRIIRRTDEESAPQRSAVAGSDNRSYYRALSSSPATARMLL